MSDSLFETQEGTAQQDSGTPAQSPEGQGNDQGNNGESLFADQLAAITAEDGRQKYADVATALGSIPHAQSRIQELQNKIKELEEENARKAGFEEVLSRLDGNNNATGSTNPEAMSVETMQSLMEQMLEQRELTAKAKQNELAVTESLAKKFGDKEKALEQLKAKAAQLGVSMDVVRQLAQASPNAVLSYFESGGADSSAPTGFGGGAFSNAPAGEPDPYTAARSKLFGQSDPLVNKWRSASS